MENLLIEQGGKSVSLFGPTHLWNLLKITTLLVYLAPESKVKQVDKKSAVWNSTTVILLPSSPSGDRFLRFLKEVNLTGLPSSVRRKSVEILIPIKIFSLPIFSYWPSSTKNEMIKQVIDNK